MDSSRAEKRAYYLSKAVNKAQRRYHLFDEDDSILVAVSGGKDSMTMLELLFRRNRYARYKARLIAANIESDHACGRTVSRHWLDTWCAERGIQLVSEQIVVAQELAEAESSPCFRCAWNRRKALFRLADTHNCNKLAFGHHADDIAETTLMNLFYAGRLNPMEARVSFFDGRLVVIRPMALIEERTIADYVRVAGYPIGGEPCPWGHDSHREKVKAIIRQLQHDSPQVKRCILSAAEHYRAAIRRLQDQQVAESQHSPEEPSDG